jgi:hypothetical protein
VIDFHFVSAKDIIITVQYNFISIDEYSLLCNLQKISTGSLIPLTRFKNDH